MKTGKGLEGSPRMNHEFLYEQIKCALQAKMNTGYFDVPDEQFANELRKRKNEDVKSREYSSINIVGTHGYSKTAALEYITKRLGISLVTLPIAQANEMGDILGMPTIEENAEGILQTVNAQIQMMPRKEGPGIVLIDDYTRAQPHILQGIMQFIQHGDLWGTKLPKGWIIVTTSNPDNGDNNVQSLDDAQITRSQNYTWVPDVKAFQEHLLDSGVDYRLVSFVATYENKLFDFTGKTNTFTNFRTIKALGTMMQYMPYTGSVKNLRLEYPELRNMSDEKVEQLIQKHRNQVLLTAKAHIDDEFASALDSHLLDNVKPMYKLEDLVGKPGATVLPDLAEFKAKFYNQYLTDTGRGVQEDIPYMSAFINILFARINATYQQLTTKQWERICVFFFTKDVGTGRTLNSELVTRVRSKLQEEGGVLQKHINVHHKSINSTIATLTMEQSKIN